MSESASKAVFLSYASQDAEVARRIADALRAAGVEVWFDQNELVGGDAWDAKIRKQIKECALFVPIISANTQARREGYFRIEWKLAAQRTHGIAEGTPFLMPVVIDETPEAQALVPAEFRDVQWTRLSEKDTPASLAARVDRLLRQSASHAAGAARTERPAGQPSAPRRRRLLMGLAVAVPAAGALFGLGVLALKRKGESSPRLNPAMTQAGPLSEAVQLAAKARALYYNPDKVGFSRDDLAVAEDLARRATEIDSGSATAWGVRAGVQAAYLARNWDTGEKRRQETQMLANRALVLNPDELEAQLALSWMLHRQGAYDQAEAILRRALGLWPDENRIRRLLGLAVEQIRRGEGRVLLEEAVRRNPRDVLARYDLAQNYAAGAVTDGAEEKGFAPALEQLDAALAVQPFGGALIMKALLAAGLKGDLEVMRATLDRLLPAERVEDRAVYAAMWCGLLERKPERVFAAGALTARTFFEDAFIFSGPKAWLLALAHRIAGQENLARLDWEAAERLLRQRLADQPGNPSETAQLATTLAWLGRKDEAAKLIAPIESAWREQLTAQTARSLAYYYAALGEAAKAAPYLRVAINRSAIVTAKTLTLDPRWDTLRGQPDFEALLAEGRAAQEAEATPSPGSRVSRDPADLAPAKSVAVLAFANLSDDKDNEYFSDGISEELLNVLAKVPGLKVSARTSAFSFKGKGVAIPEIAKQLGVAYVVEGSVRKAGNRVRITAQLIKASDGFHVWSDNFDRELKDIFAVQDEIAGLIAGKLSLTLVGGRGQKHEANAEVVQLYFEGRQLWNLRTPAALELAEKSFRRSVAIDPAFARGYAGLADVLYIRRVNFANDLGRFGKQESRLELEVTALAQKALELDPTSAEAVATLGVVSGQLWRLDEGVRQLRRAAELNPNYATAYQWLGRSLAMNGQLNEAVDALHRAAELDPLSGVIMDQLALALCVAGRAAEGLAAAERALILRPDNDTTLAWQTYALLRLHRLNEARAVLPKLQRHLADRSTSDVCKSTEVLLRAIIARVWQESGSRVELADFVAKSKARDPIAGFFVSVMAGGGREALPLPNVEDFHFFNVDKLWLPEFDLLRAEPKFVALIEHLGLTAAQERVQAFRQTKVAAP